MLGHGRFLALVVALLVIAAGASAAPMSKADRQLRTRRNSCEKADCADLVNEKRATCIYKCVSIRCWKEVYGTDPLEAGEIDNRASRFNACYRKEVKAFPGGVPPASPNELKLEPLGSQPSSSASETELNHGPGAEAQDDSMEEIAGEEDTAAVEE